MRGLYAMATSFCPFIHLSPECVLVEHWCDRPSNTVVLASRWRDVLCQPHSLINVTSIIYVGAGPKPGLIGKVATGWAASIKSPGHSFLSDQH